MMRVAMKGCAKIIFAECCGLHQCRCPPVERINVSDNRCFGLHGNFSLPLAPQIPVTNAATPPLSSVAGQTNTFLQKVLFWLCNDKQAIRNLNPSSISTDVMATYNYSG